MNRDILFQGVIEAMLAKANDLSIENGVAVILTQDTETGQYHMLAQPVGSIEGAPIPDKGFEAGLNYLGGALMKFAFSAATNVNSGKVVEGRDIKWGETEFGGCIICFGTVENLVFFFSFSGGTVPQDVEIALAGEIALSRLV